MNPVAREIYATRTTLDADGRSLPLNSEISEAESAFLMQQARGAHKSLEVGCAQGLSSLAICETVAQQGGHHTIVDPYQFSQFLGAGVTALKRAGFENYRLLQEGSEVALPALLAQEAASFDLVFIDGWHTFDHTLLDCFYGLRLLKVGGRLVVDDCDWPGIAKVIAYLSCYPSLVVRDQLTEYPPHPLLQMACRMAALVPIPGDWRYYLPHKLQRLIRRPNMVCLEKVGPDERNFDWYRPF